MNPFRTMPEPCRECARRAAEPKERKPMPKWVANILAILVGLLAVWGVLVGTYYVGGWSQEGRSFCALLGAGAGLLAVGLSGAVFSERDR